MVATAVAGDTITEPDSFTVENQDGEEVVRVKNSANVKQLANVISQAIYDNGTITLRAIGAAAINQAVKSIAVAGSLTALRGVHIAAVHGFQTVMVPSRDNPREQMESSAITFRVIPLR